LWWRDEVVTEEKGADTFSWEEGHGGRGSCTPPWGGEIDANRAEEKRREGLDSGGERHSETIFSFTSLAHIDKGPPQALLTPVQDGDSAGQKA
jgi:hypothetical protein